MADLITLPRETVQQAYDAMELYHHEPEVSEALDALRTALEVAPAAQKVEPVLADGGPPCSDHPDAPHGFNRTSSHSLGRYVCDCEGWTPEAAPAAREPLTDEQINDIWEKKVPFIEEGGDWFRIFARCIEAHHGIGKEQK